MVVIVVVPGSQALSEIGVEGRWVRAGEDIARNWPGRAVPPWP